MRSLLTKSQDRAHKRFEYDVTNVVDIATDDQNRYVSFITEFIFIRYLGYLS